MTSFARCAVALLLIPALVSARPHDAFGWLQTVVTIDAAARNRLDGGEVIVRVLPSVDGELGVFAAARLNAESEMLATWATEITQLKKSRYVLAVRRFSDPPAMDDLQPMELDDSDLEAVRRCRPGNCDLKMAGDDITSLRQAAETGGVQWKDAVLQQFKRVVLQRIAAYQAGGFAALPPYSDRRKSTDPKTAFEAILDHSPYLDSEAFAEADVESFFYWSKEQYGAGKPVIGVTHVTLCGRAFLAHSSLPSSAAKSWRRTIATPRSALPP